jgi:hypothetical protein
MAELITPPKKKKSEPVSEARRADTSLRIGMICGLLMGVNEKACNQLLKLDSREFYYKNETRIVRAAYRKFIKRGPRS